MKDVMSDEEFVRRYAAYEEKAAAAHLDRLGQTRRELREGIEFLIQERVRLRNEELNALEGESRNLIPALRTLDLAFVIAPRRTLVDGDDPLSDCRRGYSACSSPAGLRSRNLNR